MVRLQFSLLSSLVSNLSGWSLSSSANSSGRSLHALDTRHPLLNNSPTITTLYLGTFMVIRTKPTLTWGEKSFQRLTVSMDRTVVGNDEWHHHHLSHLFPDLWWPSTPDTCRVFFEGLVYIFCRCDLHVDDNLPSLASRIAPEPHEVGVKLHSGNFLYLSTHRISLLGSHSDLVCCCSHRLPVIQPLIMVNQSSLGGDVVEKGVHQNSVVGADIHTDFLAAAHDCFSFITSQALLHQHFSSVFF